MVRKEHESCVDPYALHERGFSSGRSVRGGVELGPSYAALRMWPRRDPAGRRGLAVAETGVAGQGVVAAGGADEVVFASTTGTDGTSELLVHGEVLFGDVLSAKRDNLTEIT